MSAPAGRRKAGLVSIVVFFLAVLVHAPAVRNDFVNWDDDECVVRNQRVHSLSPSNLWWMLTAFHAGNWHPATWASHAAVWSLWGGNPAAHHAANVLLHGVNAFLVFVLVIALLRAHRESDPSRAAGSGEAGPARESDLVAAGTTAILFGLHPLRVESVAWVTERKGLLSASFYLLSILAYLAGARTGGGEGGNRNRYRALSLLSFAMALAAKPMAVSLPLVLLLIDHFPLRRFDRPRRFGPVLEKAPYLFLGAGAAAVAWLAQSAGGGFDAGRVVGIGPAARLSNAIRSVVFYAEKTVWPTSLVPLYPLSSRIDFFGAPYVISWVLVLALTSLAFWMHLRGRRLWFALWSYYLVTLAPVAGIVQFGAHKAADRFTYLPGLAFALAAGLGTGRLWAWAASRAKLETILRIAVLAAAGAAGTELGVLTIRQIGHWKDSVALWERVIANDPDISGAQSNLGVAYLAAGRVDDAVAHLKTAIELGPASGLDTLHANLAGAYLRQDKVREAVTEYEEAIERNPRNARAHHGLGIALAMLGSPEMAAAEYRKAVGLDPLLAEAHDTLGALQLAAGDLDEALASLQRAVEANPELATARYHLGRAYLAAGSEDLAMGEFRKAVELRPDYASAHQSLGTALRTKGDEDGAEKHFRLALEGAGKRGVAPGEIDSPGP